MSEEKKQGLNTASQAQLMQVRQIGKLLATRINAHRPFSTWAQVERLVGIGPVRTAHLKKRFKIEDDDAVPGQNESGADDSSQNETRVQKHQHHDVNVNVNVRVNVSV